ncbi:MAG: indolepyruvate ferredoxin oxidoreductase, beta subunit [Thermotogaceae bacterium]|jgi:indolepyruvate ferredoxin oxidoreductase beta subunit|nr:indolepyruvate ferredoxin oxidoreductase, beta subunit [Thermotogaceae bacterium]MDN5337350.1 indolepyruvate ferredoxin oxidoreductase, beta subunit [Thermotogaceae bacterium]
MKFDVFIIGVGGQGIGMLSELLMRAIDYSGQRCVGVDTHGLAQRGGVVSSHIRIGEAFSPMVVPGEVDLVLALERHEAARGINFLKKGGTLVYYDTSWQPLPVRLGKEKEISNEEIERFSLENDVKVYRIRYKLPDVRMQNMALLANVVKNKLIPSLNFNHCLKAMEDLMTGDILKINQEFFLKTVNE